MLVKLSIMFMSVRTAIKINITMIFIIYNMMMKKVIISS
jgi:hypothetical protein